MVRVGTEVTVDLEMEIEEIEEGQYKHQSHKLLRVTPEWLTLTNTWSPGRHLTRTEDPGGSRGQVTA